MKKELLIVLLSIVTTVSFSQDILLFQDGNKKEVTILEITPEIIKYQKFNSSSKVVYSENKFDLIGVVFEDGEFEKFETRKNNYSKSSNSNLGDYGNNMFFLAPIGPIFGYVGIGYEHFSKSGRSSIRIPLILKIRENGLNYRPEYSIGYEHKFYPTGSSGNVRGFLGFAEHFGVLPISEYYYYENYDGNDYYYSDGHESSSYFFNDTQFIGGVQFHPSKLINITLDAGLGLGLLDFDESYPSYKIGLNLGFRF
jgi:hypothetical protein